MKLKGGSFRKKSSYFLSQKNNSLRLSSKKLPSLSFSSFSHNSLVERARQEKIKLKKFVQDLNSEYKQGNLSYLDYENKLNRVLKHKTPEHWLNYYDDYIKKHEERQFFAKEKQKFNFAPFFAILAIIFVALSIFLFYPQLSKMAQGITGFVTETLGEPAPTEPLPEENITNETEIPEVPINETPINITPETPEIPTQPIMINETGFEELIQEPAQIDLPVKWHAKIKADSLNEAKKLLHKTAKIESSSEISPGLFSLDYETPAPLSLEENISDFAKKITIYSENELNYTNILAYANIYEIVPVEKKNAINIYRTTSGAREKIQISDYLDENGNGFIDRVSWIVPHLSNETYEIDITIINVQSYPTVGGNWTVMFNTTGKADLYIRAFNGTNWTNYSNSNFDLKFLELKCGEQIINYQWLMNDSNCTSGNCAVFVSNYSCNETGYETSKVLTEGKHTIQFVFGTDVDYAFNQAGNFTTAPNSASSISMTPINDTAFVVAWIDWTLNDTLFQIFNTNGTKMGIPIVVDTEVERRYAQVSVDSINNSEFIIAWTDMNGAQRDASFAIYYFNRTNKKAETDANTATAAINTLALNATSISVSSLGTGAGIDRFVMCWKDDASADASYSLFNNAGTNVVAENDYDAGAGNLQTMSQLIECDAINGSRYGIIYADGASNDMSWGTYSRAGAAVSAIADLDDEIGVKSQMSLVGINDSAFAMAWFDSNAFDINFTIRTYGNTAVTAVREVDKNPGTFTRIRMAAANNNSASDYIVLVYYSQTNNNLTAKVYDAFGNVAHPGFTVAAQTVFNYSYPNFDVIGYDRISNNHLCNGTFIVAYTNSSGVGVFKGFQFNGSEWNGSCPLPPEAQPSETTPPWSVQFVAPTPAINASNQTSASLIINASVQDTVGISTCVLDLNGTNQTTYMNKAGTGTNISCNRSLTLVTGTYYFKVHANDTSNNWNMSMYRTVFIDSNGPTIAAARINATTPQNISRRVKVNASITDTGTHLSNVTLTVIPPSGTGYNTSVSSSGSEYYNETIALDVSGKWQFKFWANDSFGNNATVVYAQDGGSNLYINASNGPQFANYNKNATLVGPGKFIKFNVTVTDGDGISYVNGTVNGATAVFSLVSGSEYNYQWGPCSVSDATVDFTYVSGNDTMNMWNSTSVTGVSAACDVDGPTISATGKNATNITLNEWFCVNATVSDTNSVSTVYANIWNTTAFNNLTMTDTGATSCDVGSGDGLYGINVQGTKAGYWNYTRVYANDSLNNWATYSITNNLTINVTAAANTAPIIEYVSAIPNTDPLESNAKAVTFSFTAYDAQHVADLDTGTIKINLSVSGSQTDVSHYNTTCIDSGNIDADRENFTCAVDLWYWEPDTKWNVTINISDDSALESTNRSTWFSYTTLTAIKIGPSSTSFTGATPGSSNITGSSSVLVNNTGNDYTRTISINASNLWNSSAIAGSASKYLGAENFTIDFETGGTKPECDIGGRAFSLLNGSYLTITGATLPRGNNTNNEGQRSLYYCLTNVSSSLPAGTYDTTLKGPWWIKILLVAVVPASALRKKKRKKEEKELSKQTLLEVFDEKLKEKYGVGIEQIVDSVKKEKQVREIREVEIPISVFEKDKKSKLGPSEAIVKYLKENIGLKLSEIARLLNRDQRTIWITHNNAVNKMKGKIVERKARISIPVSILRNRKLSILETIVMHLIEKGIKKNEIAKLLGRDIRIIYTIYSRAKSKMKK